MSAAADVGTRFVKALATKDAPAKEVVDDIVLRYWFEPTDHIEALEGIEPGESVGPRHRIGYRVRVKNADGAFAVDQQAYFEVDNERISWLRVMCAGYVPADTTP
jgi:hypothetical protein